MIPGNTGLFGVQQLVNAEAAPLQGLTITLSTLPNQPTGTPNLLGTSVSGNLGVSAAGNTLDADGIGDLLVGSAALTPNIGAVNVGTLFAIEGTFIASLIPPPLPVSITVTIGIDQPFPPFVNINPTTPATMLIFVFSDATLTPPFDPTTQLNPATVVVNGVAFPNATIASAGDLNGDGIPDAVITIQPRSALGLTAATTSITLTARTFTTGPNANRAVSGTAAITVTPPAPPSGLGLFPTTLFGLPLFNQAVPPWGSRMVPTLNVVYGNFNWKQLPVNRAYKQFEPRPANLERVLNYYQPTKQERPIGSSLKEYQSYHTSTLSQYVFTRSNFPVGLFDARNLHKKK